MGLLGAIFWAIIILIIGFSIGVLAVKVFHFSIFQFLDFLKNFSVWVWNSLISLIAGLKGG
jgi:hypothetical protein